MKYIKPNINVRKLEVEGDLLDFASQENETKTESLDDNSDDPINKPVDVLGKYNEWDTDNEE